MLAARAPAARAPAEAGAQARQVQDLERRIFNLSRLAGPEGGGEAPEKKRAAEKLEQQQRKLQRGREER